jgi:hypothetical protein
MTDATGPPATASESSGAQEKAQEVAGEVKGRTQEAAGQAQEKVQEAAEQAQGMVREQVDQRSTQAGEKVAETAQDMRSVGEELRKQGKDGPAKLADRAAERTERLGSYLTESDGDKLLSDVEDFGRRQPLAVLAGGLVVGVAAARFLKASSRGRYRSRMASDQPTRELQPPVPSQPPMAPAEPVGAAPAAAQGVPPAPVAGR